MRFDGCSTSVGPGGGLHVSESLDVSGNLTAVACHSGEDGGGLHVAHGLSQTAGDMRHSQEPVDGTCISLFLFLSFCRFRSCSARKKGGGIKIARGGIKFTGGTRSFETWSPVTLRHSACERKLLHVA